MLRWLSPISFPILLTACTAVSGITPYADTPTCPPPGAKFPGDHECYYTLEITEIDEQAGRAAGKIPRSQVEWNKNQNEGFMFKDMVRQATPIDHFPFFEYSFPVKGSTKDLAKGQVAQFKSKANSGTLELLSSDAVCKEKFDSMQLHVNGKYPGGATVPYGDYTSDPEFQAELKKCPQLKDLKFPQ
jgi:hypothetical protein